MKVFSNNKEKVEQEEKQAIFKTHTHTNKPQATRNSCGHCLAVFTQFYFDLATIPSLTESSLCPQALWSNTLPLVLPSELLNLYL